MQVLGEGITNKVFHTNKLQIASEEEQLKLRTDFENMFTNKIEGKIENVEKKDESKDIIFTVYENEDNISENYTLNVHIPNFNIKDENIEELNNKISTEYKQKVNQILNNKGNQIIYSVEYSAYILIFLLYFLKLFLFCFLNHSYMYKPFVFVHCCFLSDLNVLLKI